MSLFTNKHVVVALLVAPILALIAYFAVDMVVSEKPQQARSGQSYPMLAKSNCRYSSGRCDLVNGDINIGVVATDGKLVVQSSHKLDGLRMAIARAAGGAEEHLRVQTEDDAKHWQAALPAMLPDQGRLRMVLSIAGSNYFAETELAFTDFEAGFDASKINRR